MKSLKLIPLSLIICLVGSLLFVSCDLLKKDADEDGGGVSEAELNQFFLENADAPFVMFEAFSRLLLVLEGNQVNGVTLTPRVGGKSANLIYDGVIGLDFDYDGEFEVDVIGHIEFPGDEANLDNGATLFITEVDGADIEGTATADVTEDGPGAANLVGVGSFGPTGKDKVKLDFDATVKFFESSITGYSEAEWGDWEADIYFEPAPFQWPPYVVRVDPADGEEFIIGAGLF